MICLVYLLLVALVADLLFSSLREPRGCWLASDAVLAWRVSRKALLWLAVAWFLESDSFRWSSSQSFEWLQALTVSSVRSLSKCLSSLDGQTPPDGKAVSEHFAARSMTKPKFCSKQRAEAPFFIGLISIHPLRCLVQSNYLCREQPRPYCFFWTPT